VFFVVYFVKHSPLIEPKEQPASGPHSQPYEFSRNTSYLFVANSPILP
jgi:hypothetical protein